MKYSSKSWTYALLAVYFTAMLPVSINLQLASGYGYMAFGLWRPPASPYFREILTSIMFVFLVLSVLLSALVLKRGPNWPRLVVLLALLFDISLVTFLVISGMS